ncbi:hypothetical protein M9Y10_002743 [Tritrichomonas musculus]|uniref:BTB domain-containing protein n=1 Tax=Tritrichomonas musculus TaxID=1915356 RepID=A0ABR2LAM8_9EUKA
MTNINCFRNNLWDLQQKNRYTDVTLEVGNDRYDCHRNVLISNNGYFYDLFMRGFGEENSNEIKIRVPDPNNHFKFILKYLYTGDTSFLSFDNAFSIMTLAQYFQLDDLVAGSQNYFCQFLNSGIKNGDEFEQGIGSLIDALTNNETVPLLSDKFKDAIAANFEYFSKNPQFLRVPEFLVRSILSRMCLRIPSEVFLAWFLSQYIDQNNLSGNSFKQYVRWQFLKDEDWLTFDYTKFCDERFKEQTLRTRKNLLKYETPPLIALSISATNYQDTLTSLHRYTSVRIKTFDELKVVNNQTFANNNSDIIVDGLNLNPPQITIRTTFDKNGGIYLSHMHISMVGTKGNLLLCYTLKDSSGAHIKGAEVPPSNGKSKVEFDIIFNEKTVCNNLKINFIAEDKRQIRIDSMTISGFSYDKRKL